MELALKNPIPAWTGFGQAADYAIGGFVFEDLLVRKINFAPQSDLIRYQVYNKEFGLVRSIDFSESEGVISGFDLIMD